MNKRLLIPMDEDICKYSRTEETINCPTCGGLTNMCGKYEPRKYLTIFDRFNAYPQHEERKRRRVIRNDRG